MSTTEQQVQVSEETLERLRKEKEAHENEWVERGKGAGQQYAPGLSYKDLLAIHNCYDDQGSLDTDAFRSTDYGVSFNDELKRLAVDYPDLDEDSFITGYVDAVDDFFLEATKRL